MEVILLDNVSKLGIVGDIVEVKPGYGRNYLIPNKLALQATKENKDLFEQRRKELEEINHKKIEAAKKNLSIFDNRFFNINRQSGEDGRLFGSVSLKDIAEVLIADTNIEITKSKIFLNQSIKYIGIYKVRVNLHGDIFANILLNVARNDAEAKEAKEKYLKGEILEVKSEKLAKTMTPMDMGEELIETVEEEQEEVIEITEPLATENS